MRLGRKQDPSTPPPNEPVGERGAPPEQKETPEGDKPAPTKGPAPAQRPAAGTPGWVESLQTARRAGVKEGIARTIAQSFCLLGGLALVAVGVLGFIFGGTSFDTGEAIHGDDFIIFEVNGWHNVVHIVTGAFLVLMSTTAVSAALGALIFGLLYAAVAVWGFVEGDQIVELVATDSADNWLHVGLAAVGILIGLGAGALGASARRGRKRVGLGSR